MVSAQREFEFTSADFERIRGLIYQRAGITLNVSKEQMVYSRLARRLRARGMSRFSDYLALLEKNDPVEWEEFTNSLTTNLTSFFRESHHFHTLAEYVRGLQVNRPISLWCSACSTGEEAYSLAMTMADLFGSLTPPVQILATDVDTQVLHQAEQASYPADRLQQLPPDKLKRYFVKAPGADAACARPELRKLITFRKVNLLDAIWPVRGPFDAIFCRNVMIYFDKDTQYAILRKFVPLLQPHGLLFAGHSENFFHAADLFKPKGKTVYELAAQGQAHTDKGKLLSQGGR